MERFVLNYDEFINEARKRKNKPKIEYKYTKESLYSKLEQVTKKVAPLFIDGINSQLDKTQAKIVKIIKECPDGYGAFNVDFDWETLRTATSYVEFEPSLSDKHFNIKVMEVQSDGFTTPVWLVFMSSKFLLADDIDDIKTIIKNIKSIAQEIGKIYKIYEPIGIENGGQELYRRINKLTWGKTDVFRTLPFIQKRNGLKVPRYLL